MHDEFAAAMRRATELTRSQDLTAAMRVIQDALGAYGRHGAAGGSSDITPPPTPIRKLHPIDPGTGLRAGDAEPISSSSPKQMLGMKAPNPTQAPPRLRRPLGDVLRLLREGCGKFRSLDGLQGLKQPRGLRRGRVAEIPPGAQFLAHSYSCAAGSRSYMLYIPKSAQDRLSGLLVMLHGCKQDAEDFAAGSNMNSLAEAHGLLVAYPAQARSANPSACWNWFNPADQVREAGEPSIIAGITRHLMGEYGLNRQQVFVAGLSAGGAMAAVMGETYPDLYSAVGVHSGLPYGSASDVASAFAAMRGEAPQGAEPARRSGPLPGPLVRTIIFHGGGDPLVHPSNAGRIELAARLRYGAAGQPVRSRGRDGRGYERIVTTGPEGHAIVEAWIIDDAGHAWSGGQPAGSFTDPLGPDASKEMVRFFLQ